MFASKQTTRQLLAFGVVAMFVLCAFTVVAESSEGSVYGGVNKDDSSTSKDQVYNVELSTSQTFTYSNIATNLDGYGTITYSWKGDASTNGISWTEETKTLSGQITTAGTYQGVLTATWTASEDSTLQQTATQTINFTVTAGVDVPTSVSAAALVGMTTTDTIISIAVTGGANLTMSVNYGSTTGTTVDNTFTPTLSSDGTKITFAPTDALVTSDVGAHKYYVTLTNSKTGDKDTVEVILNVFEEIAITNTTLHFYTYEGATAGIVASGFNFTVNYDTDGDENTTVDSRSITYSPESTVLSDTDDKSVKVDVSTGYSGTPGSLIGSSNISTDYTATLTVTGSVTNTDGVATTTSSANASAIFTVYKALAFTSDPSIDNVTITQVSGTTSVNVSAYIAGAKYVTFNWGDGTSTDKIVTGTSASTYAANHVYKGKDVYMITIEATNDVGVTTSKAMYSTEDATITDDTTDNSKDTTSASKSLKDSYMDNWFSFTLIICGLLAGCLCLYFGQGLYRSGAIVGIVTIVALVLIALGFGDLGI